jgi:hypothetical protein
VVVYNVVLFIHILGVAALFAAFGVIQVGGAAVRRAHTVEEAQRWLGLLKVTGPMFGIAFLLIVAAGLYMTVDVWTFKTSWVDVALVTAIIMMAVGSGIVGRGLGSMGAAAASTEPGPLPPALQATIHNRVVWTSMFTLNAMGIAVIWLMTNKPGWVESIAVVVVLAVIGAALGMNAVRRESPVTALS